MLKDHEYTNKIVCPYCGYEYGDSWEFENDEGEEDCAECNKKFTYTRNVSVDYSTRKIPCKKHNYEKKLRFRFIKDTKFCKEVDGKYKDIKLLEKDWEYIEIYPCKNCNEEDYRRITKKEYIKKYPENHERNVEQAKK